MQQVLVIRMSSLGDVILSTAFLESLPENIEVDWVIAKEFAFVLKDHPKIRRLYVFDKKAGLRGWIHLMVELSRISYQARIDLHVTIRSQIARVVFFFQDLLRFKFTRWNQISKQRFRFFGYLFFKQAWPQILRPVPIWKRFAQLAGGSNSPNMSFLIKNSDAALQKYHLVAKKYFVVMPSSRWESKEWDVQSYLELCVHYSKTKLITPVILGRVSDSSAANLTQFLSQKNITHQSILSESDFSVTASIIQGAAFYIGSDTGLAHLAEALGTSAHMIFGPTRPDLGFGPWRGSSSSIYADVWCSPCSKDGRICYRVTDRFACLKKISPHQAEAHLP